ncbi:hypothetical protein U6A24_20840 [Aquimarina gracilis]|uniref:Uncharacterized protein n=1 Tax=Aquimarina gracilis TaxID=874422 RepID=A0ABU6A199_9FLAO|nr:hypothetical protein [Aquimarina gracilis]MEB3347935.1 hypothetical protein [Aquimarina gracilis]
MNRPFGLFAIIILFMSCSEGDIIETDINFTATPEDCFNGNDFVIYKIDTDTNRSISLNFTSSSFEVNQVPAENASETITLNGTSNVLIYRQFDSAINGEEYFCASIPPSGIIVTEELISENGTATISYTPISGNTFTRTIVVSNVTFKGPGIEIREEVFEFGSYEITTP